MILIRLLAGVGLLAFGYYIGREVGRTESVRDELARKREATDDADVDDDQESVDADK